MLSIQEIKDYPTKTLLSIFPQQMTITKYFKEGMYYSNYLEQDIPLQVGKNLPINDSILYFHDSNSFFKSIFSLVEYEYYMNIYDENENQFQEIFRKILKDYLEKQGEKGKKMKQIMKFYEELSILKRLHTDREFHPIFFHLKQIVLDYYQISLFLIEIDIHKRQVKYIEEETSRKKLILVKNHRNKFSPLGWFK